MTLIIVISDDDVNCNIGNMDSELTVFGGIAKNEAQLTMLFALSNLWMARRANGGGGRGAAVVLRTVREGVAQGPSGNRRVLFYGRNGASLEEMALPPRHLQYQFLVNSSRREILLCLYIRSNDVGLGRPFSLTEGATLLHLAGCLAGYTHRWFSYFSVTHTYLREPCEHAPGGQLTREPLAAHLGLACLTTSRTTLQQAATNRRGWRGFSQVTSGWKSIKTMRR